MVARPHSAYRCYALGRSLPMQRRTFLAQSAAAVSLAAAAQTPPSAPPRKSKIASSVMLWTLKGSFEERVETAAKAGMQSVELVGEYTAWTTDAEIAAKKKFVNSFGFGI